MPIRLAPGFAALALFTTPAMAEDVPSFAKDVPQVKTGDPVFAFNGKDLTGFYPYTKQHKYDDPKKVFTVHDGMIHISGEDFGGVATAGNFSNYHLITEWKWGEKTWAPREDKTRDSGILLHCVGPDGAAGGPVDAVPGVPDHRRGLRRLHHGRREDQNEPDLPGPRRRKPDDLRPLGRAHHPRLRPLQLVGTRPRLEGPSWGSEGTETSRSPSASGNRMEVICDGDTITNILNGYVVNVGTKSSLTEGKIQFQSEGAELFFRKIEIRPLLKK